MPVQSTIPAKPIVLKWAREQSRYSIREAAALLSISAGTLAAIERGDPELTPPVFRKMLAVYQQVESVLLLPEPPDTPTIPHDYRTPGSAPTTISRETLSVIRDARRVQDYLSELAREEPEVIPLPRLPQANLADDPAELAKGERYRLSVSTGKQASWEPREAFEQWRGVVQAFGVTALLKKMPWEDCRGLSLWNDDLLPVIVVNSDDSVSARNFTLFHEYAHLLLRKAGICITEPSQTLRGQVERWCNTFSANFLVPSSDLSEAVRLMFPRVGRSDWTLNNVRRLAGKFRVSPYVMARRLKELKLSDFYDANISELRNLDRKAKKKRPDGQKPVRIRPEVQRLSEVGTGLAFVVLDAWRGAVIDAGDAADILQLRPDQLADFQERARATRNRRSA
ncbi:MAG: XRE family transcriptional regulator [Dehalococcoidia bacterium]|nr:XRE family transcriptional regulator [Dehalococcoidia bacterium]